MKTYTTKPKDISTHWYLIDAKGQVLGRLATKIANLLQGKNKSIFSPHINVGDFVVVINAEKIKITGNKLANKTYYHYSGYTGGMKEITLGDQMKKDPTMVIKKAVKGMLPKNKLNSTRMNRLKVHVGDQHPYGNQSLIQLEGK